MSKSEIVLLNYSYEYINEVNSIKLASSKLVNKQSHRLANSLASKLVDD